MMCREEDALMSTVIGEGPMPETMAARVEALRALSVHELREQYKAAFDGQEAPSSNRDYLWRRVAWRIQERELGGLSSGAQQKLGELETVSVYSPRIQRRVETRGADAAKTRRLLSPGTLIRRAYKGQIIEVKVLEQGFEYQGKVYRSLTAVAEEATGSHWSGRHFFGLD